MSGGTHATTRRDGARGSRTERPGRSGGHGASPGMLLFCSQYRRPGKPGCPEGVQLQVGPAVSTLGSPLREATVNSRSPPFPEK